MSDPTLTTSEIIARHGIAWLGGGNRSEVYACACGHRATGTEDEPFAAAHVRHVAELVEQAALAPIRAALDRHPRCGTHPDDDTITCGWKSVVASIQWAIDQNPDQWLRDTLARAWDEGAEAGYDDAEAGREEKHNPYREEDRRG